ncbi:MAG: hypothetical protein WDM81_11645 [Rhizomicrobium sp.]
MRIRVFPAWLLIVAVFPAYGAAADTDHTYDTPGRMPQGEFSNRDFTLHTCDAGSNQTAISISVRSEQPTLVPDTWKTKQDTPANYNPRSNNINSTAMMIVAIRATLRGSAVINGGASPAYGLIASYFDSDTFYYAISHGGGRPSCMLDTATILKTFLPPPAGPDTEMTVATCIRGDSFAYVVADPHVLSANSAVTTIVNVPPATPPDCNNTCPDPPRGHTFNPRADPVAIGNRGEVDPSHVDIRLGIEMPSRLRPVLRHDLCTTSGSVVGISDLLAVVVGHGDEATEGILGIGSEQFRRNFIRVLLK